MTAIINLYAGIVSFIKSIGLTAATSLRRHGGFDVTLLEADERIGGRVKSAILGIIIKLLGLDFPNSRTSDISDTYVVGDHFIEHGAQWVHGNDNNSVFIKASSHGLLDTGKNNLKVEQTALFEII